MDELKTEALRASIEDIKRCAERAAAASGRRAEDITILAATKTRSAQEINAAIGCGISDIGENRVQELLSKRDGLDLARARLHFIGALQTNKVRQIIDKVCMIHSVDSERLADEISRQAEKRGLTMDILIEVNIDGEQSKSGAEPEQVGNLVEYATRLPGVCVRGLMAIPPQTDDKAMLRGYFRQMKQLFVDNRPKSIDNDNMDVLSMGMSGDFEIAIEEGATLVRIGTALFGSRD